MDRVAEVGKDWLRGFVWLKGSILYLACLTAVLKYLRLDTVWIWI